MEDDFQEMKILNYASDVILRIQHFVLEIIFELPLVVQHII